jgi:hypothetical protein
VYDFVAATPYSNPQLRNIPQSVNLESALYRVYLSIFIYLPTPLVTPTQIALAALQYSRAFNTSYYLYFK